MKYAKDDKRTRFTAGADPEFFLRKRDGSLVIACGLIGGSKKEPVPLPGLPEGYAVQEDNVMVEYNVPPSTDYDHFVYSISEGRNASLEWARDKSGNARLGVLCEHEALLDTVHLGTPGVMTFGCSPDFDAYSGGAACAPVTADVVGNRRFAGGHIHLGYDLGYEIPPFVVAAFADLFIGLRVCGYDAQPTRRSLYGLAGRYRPTPYGIEYRTLSNFWTRPDGHENGYTHEVADAVFSLGHFLYGATEQGLKSAYASVPWRDVAGAINSEDRRTASRIITNFREKIAV